MASRTPRNLLALLLLAGLSRPAPAAGPDGAGVEFFERRVRPLLVKHCYSCHSAEARKLRGGLRLDFAEGVRKGGTSGPALVPGNPAASLLIRAVRYEDKRLRMPPGGKLSDAEIADLEGWVKRGAPDPRTAGVTPAKPPDLARAREFWSFRPVREHPVPAVKDGAWPRNPVDRFILAKLESKGLRPVARADRRTLIRRATYDLTGLPPTPEEVEAFVADRRPDAYERLVERLLASPAYGERWGRHWLDVVRYADTAGDNSDFPVPQMVKYRDWVIRAFNRDLPYDEFVRRQLAGDLNRKEEGGRRKEGKRRLSDSSFIPHPSSFDSVIATGYLANARRFGSYEDARYPWHLTIEDTIDNLGRTFLGLTVACARCHDHKFDPVPQEDYYALYGFFQSTRYPWPGIELDQAPHDLVPLAPPDRVAAEEKARREKLAPFDAEIKRLLGEKVAAEKALKEAMKAKEDEGQKARLAKARKRVEQLTRSLQEARERREKLAKQPPPYEVAYAVADLPGTGRKKVGNARVHLKGEPERLGKEVPRRFPLVLGGRALPPGVKGSGRLELARWLTDPANPLTARVMVNRLWHYHFGKGIVQTPSDFGRQGRPPTHPELLDYLARELVQSGWSVKSMHRLILLSRTYQLSTRDDAANARLDADNDYMWRFNRRRLDAESVRDTLLAVSGDLDRSPGGAHPFPDQTTWKFTQHNPFKAVYDTNRRSVYLMTQRIQRHPFLALFDGADPNASTARRVTSTTPLQALYLMNDPFVHARARAFARRLLAEGADDPARVGRAYLLAFGRPPDGEERSAALTYLARVRDRLRAGGTPEGQLAAKGWESFARALFLTNEFVYVD
jgi:hypothetical protein